jgi:hypothetical protein
MPWWPRGAEHDRDQNAALNIACLGREILCPSGHGSPVFWGGEASRGGVLASRRPHRCEEALDFGSEVLGLARQF